MLERAWRRCNTRGAPNLRTGAPGARAPTRGMSMRLAFCSCCKIQSVERQPTWALIQHAREVVLKEFGISLHPEVERIGEWN